MAKFADLQRLAADILGVDLARVTPRFSFARDLTADSLDRIDLIAGIEATFQVKLEDEVPADMRNVGDRWRHLEPRYAVSTGAVGSQWQQPPQKTT